MGRSEAGGLLGLTVGLVLMIAVVVGLRLDPATAFLVGLPVGGSCTALGALIGSSRGNR